MIGGFRSWAKHRATPHLWMLLGFNAHLEGQYQYMWTDYMAEYPPERVSQVMPSATLDTNTVNNAQHTPEI